MKSTKIVCTLGPACDTEEKIMGLIQRGMNVARLNFSHGTWEQHKAKIHMLKEINRKLGEKNTVPSSVGIMADTKGAEIRTGDVETPILIKAGEKVVFSSKPLHEEKMKVIIVNYNEFGKDVKKAEQIILDNGTMIFELIEVRKDGSVVAKASDDGEIGSRRHVNLPGAELSIPSITEKDWVDIENASSEGVDFFALSFVSKAKDVEDVRTYLEKKGRKACLIAKIENRQAVTNMHEIIQASDAVMVARGDLGAEVPFERIPVIQDELVYLCREAGKPVIVATQMLESMITNAMPTRAEVTDIAHAATTRTDSTMLSGETAGGKHPEKSLEAMVRVLTETEKHISQQRKMESARITTDRDAQAEAAVTFAVSSNAKALVIMTKTGNTALDICRFRPALPIIAFTPDESVQRTLQLSYGIIPLCIPFDDKDPEQTLLAAFETAKKYKLLKKGETCVLISNARAKEASVSTVQIRQIG